VTSVSLQNLLGISLEQITPQKETVRRLLDGAARHIADARVKAISAETHFSWKQRNLTEYTGDIIPESAVSECLSHAESLHAAAIAWLKKHKPNLR